MLKKRLFMALSLAILGAGLLSSVATLQGASLNITGTESKFKNSIFWMGVPRISRDEAITATPSGNITTAYQLTAGISQVTVAASSGDAVKLPLTTGGVQGSTPGGGLLMIVINGQATNPINVFPAQAADTINALSGGTAFSLGAGKTAMFVVGNDGKWYTLPLAP